MAAGQSAQAAFPDVKIPSSKEPYLLGRKKNWGELETAIKPLEGFHVTSAAAEAHLAKTRTMFDESKNDNGWGIIHDMVGNLGGDNDALLEKLLALGLHPDLENNNTWRPSHHCGQEARPKSAKAISLCRPNLSAKNRNNRTPLEAAHVVAYTDDDPNFPEAERAKIRPAVTRVWEEVEKNGFPSIAEMASNKQWFAVQNLVRRRVPLLRLSTEKHHGRTAIQWAVHHGESSLAEELRYFLERHPSDLVVALDQEAKQTATKIKDMDTMLDKSVKALEAELKRAQDTASKDQKTVRDEMRDIQKDLKLAQDTSSKGQKNLSDQIQAFQKESKDNQDEVTHEMYEIRGRLDFMQRTAQEDRDSRALFDSTVQSKMDMMREEFLLVLTRQSEETEKMREIMERSRVEREAELSKLRKRVKELEKGMKELEHDVEDLQTALEKAQRPAASADGRSQATAGRQKPHNKKLGDGWT